MAFDLVIFDCDGVLVDSERICNEVLAASVSKLGLNLSYEETVRTFVGRSMTSCLEIITARIGYEPPHSFLENHQRNLLARLDAEVEMVNGVQVLLEELDIPYCVASSGDYSKMRVTLGRTGLLPYLEGRLFSASDVARAKPDPELFLHAARVMGADPSACAVIEDTVPGVQAGVRAGMTVYGYAATVGAEALKAEGAIPFDRMADLIKLLNETRRDADALSSASKHGA